MRHISTYGIWFIAGCIIAIDVNLAYILLGMWAASVY